MQINHVETHIKTYTLHSDVERARCASWWIWWHTDKTSQQIETG